MKKIFTVVLGLFFLVSAAGLASAAGKKPHHKPDPSKQHKGQSHPGKSTVKQ